MALGHQKYCLALSQILSTVTRCGVLSTIRVIVIVWIEVNSESRRLVSLQSSASFQLPRGDWDNLGNYMITFLGSARWALVSSLHISWKRGVKEPVALCAKSMVRGPTVIVYLLTGTVIGLGGRGKINKRRKRLNNAPLHTDVWCHLSGRWQKKICQS